MSVTIYVEGWDQNCEIVKYYLKDLYPDLDDSYFEHDPFVKKEESTGLLFEERSESSYPDFSMTNGSMAITLDFIGRKNIMFDDEDGTGSVPQKNISKFLADVCKARNSIEKSNLDKENKVITEGNLTTMNVSQGRMSFYLDQIMHLLHFANKKGVGIYWA